VKTLIKVVIAAALINAAARVGLAYAGFYQLKDQAQQVVTFGASASTGDIQNQIAEKAAALSLPVDPSQIDVERDGLKTIVTTHYTQPVEVFPNYTYPVDIRFAVEAISMGGLGSSSTPVN
jgi:hypothetical protein